METEVITLPWVEDFIVELDLIRREDVHRVIHALRIHGHLLSMPLAKPVGKGLWELRVHTIPQIRILYGFYERKAVLLVAFKKQQAAIHRRDFDLARKRLQEYCRRVN
jgi:phage-related protein